MAEQDLEELIRKDTEDDAVEDDAVKDDTVKDDTVEDETVKDDTVKKNTVKNGAAWLCMGGDNDDDDKEWGGDEDDAELRHLTVAALRDMEEMNKPWLCRATLAQYEPMIRWLEYRAYRRCQFQKAKVDKVTRGLAVFMFVICTISLFAGWLIQLGPWLFSKIFYWVEGWGEFWLETPIRQAISWHLVGSFVFVSFIGLLSVLHISTSPYFISTSLSISKAGVIAPLALLLIETFVIQPFCWIPLRSSNLETFCATEHDILWKFAAFSFAWLHTSIGIAFGCYETIIAFACLRFYALLPLVCLLGPLFEIQHFKPILFTSHLTDVLLFARPLVLDPRVIKLIYDELRDSSPSSHSNGGSSQERCQFAFIAFRIKTMYQMSVSWWCENPNAFDACYLGQVNKNRCPDGIGLWVDRRLTGETLYGYWKNGIPEAPFESFSKNLSSAFSTSRIAFTYPSATNRDKMSFGHADVEVCLSGLPLREFPSLLAVHKIPNLPPHELRKNKSIDIELSESLTFNEGLGCNMKRDCPLGSTQQYTTPRASSAYYDVLDDSAMSQSELSQSLSYTICDSDGRGSKLSYAFASTESPTKEASAKKCIVVVCPSYWPFKKCLLSSGSLAGLFGSSEGISVLAISQQKPINCMCEWFYWVISPLIRCKRKSGIKPNYLLEVLTEVQRIGYSEVNVVSIGDGCKTLIATLEKVANSAAKLNKFKSMSLVFPYFRMPISKNMNLCRKVTSKVVTIYTCGHSTENNLQCSSSDAWLLYSAYQIRYISQCETAKSNSELHPFLADDGQLELRDDVDVIDVNALFQDRPDFSATAADQIPDPVLSCLGRSFAFFAQGRCKAPRPELRRAFQNSDIVQDIRSVILYSTRAHQRYPIIRQSTEGVWAFQKTFSA